MAVNFAAQSIAAGGLAPTTSNKKGMRDITLNLDGVNAQTINAQGDFFMVQAVGTAGAVIFLSFDDGPFVQRVLGDGNRIQYSKITVNASAATAVTLQVGYGYANKAAGSINANVTATEAPPAHNPAQAQSVVAAGTQSKILAANANGLGVVIGVPSTQSAGVWVGDVTAANGVGYYLEPGVTLTIYTTADVYAFNASGGAVNVTSMALTK